MWPVASCNVQLLSPDATPGPPPRTMFLCDLIPPLPEHTAHTNPLGHPPSPLLALWSEVLSERSSTSPPHDPHSLLGQRSCPGTLAQNPEQESGRGPAVADQQGARSLRRMNQGQRTRVLHKSDVRAILGHPTKLDTRPTGLLRVNNWSSPDDGTHLV